MSIQQGKLLFCYFITEPVHLSKCFNQVKKENSNRNVELFVHVQCQHDLCSLILNSSSSHLQNALIRIFVSAYTVGMYIYAEMLT